MDKIFKEFDPSRKDHVEWLKLIHKTAKNMEKARLDVVFDNNPFSVKIKPIDIPEIQFVLDAKYTDAIFEKNAYIL